MSNIKNIETCNEFTHNGLVHVQVYFIPDQDVKCDPPYIKGKKDCCWVSFFPGNRPKTKKQWEKRIGIKIQ